MRYYKLKSDELSRRRRDQIIEAADRSFRKRGFHATTLREIAQEFGMSVGHIYNYFSGKDAILEALIHQKMEMCLSMLTRSIPSETDTLRERLSPVVDMYLDPEVAPIVIAVASEALINDNVLKIVKTSRRRMCEYILELIRKDVTQNEWTPVREELVRHRIIATLAMLEGLQTAVQFDNVDPSVMRDVVLGRLVAIRDSEQGR